MLCSYLCVKLCKHKQIGYLSKPHDTEKEFSYKNTESVYYTVSTELDTASLHISLFLKYFKIDPVTAASCSHLYYLLPKADPSDLLNIYFSSSYQQTYDMVLLSGDLHILTTVVMMCSSTSVRWIMYTLALNRTYENLQMLALEWYL